MIIKEPSMKKLDKIKTVREAIPDDIFITCVSFEERCLGTIRKFDNYLSDKVIIFKFVEDNTIREQNLFEMENILRKLGLADKCKKIFVKHGMTTEGILELHNYCIKNNLLKASKSLRGITLDITTFTKKLLFEVLFYITNILKPERLRLLYTLPGKYASPQEEGSLSYGIKSIRIIPFFWNRWSTIKDDMLMVILGYEEMRAWSLITSFDADVNYLFITKPGSKPQWDTHCKSYNQRLLKQNYEIRELPALDPFATIKILENTIIKNKLYHKYNIFIAPLGTKPQILGIFYFLNRHKKAYVNIVSTTAIEHNVPYYSQGIGETYHIFSEDISDQ
jgi:hypothetical protein